MEAEDDSCGGADVEQQPGPEQPSEPAPEPVPEAEPEQEPDTEMGKGEASEYDAPLAPEEETSEQVTIASEEPLESSEPEKTVPEPEPEADHVPEPDSVVEEAAKPSATPEYQPPAASSLSLKITPPRSHPAGPPPVTEETERFSSEPMDNTNDGDDEETKEDISSEPKEKGKKSKKKKKKKNRPEMWAKQAQEAERRRLEEEAREEEDTKDVEVEYIQEELELDPLDPMYRTFSKIFATFKIVDPKEAQAMKEEEVNNVFHV